eukprot:GHUV01005897.1.p1 GENE.GHUV01005897.1~~GHUV01005897.1.p1  ORF type:complete len:363 (+),score=81.13 GHUV01005897.1:791-1879(+)
MSLCYYSLKYANCELESIYEQDQAKAVVLVDRTLSAFKLSITVVLVVTILLGVLPASHAALVMWLLYMATLSVQQLIIQRHTDYYMQHRMYLVLLFKVALAACLTGLIVTHTLEPIHSWGTFAKVLFMGGGIVMVNCTGVLMPVLWRYHIIHSSMILSVFNTLFLPSVIDTLLCTPQSQHHLQLIHGAIESAAFQLGNTMMPMSLAATSVSRTVARGQAYTLTLWLQLYLGLLVPSMYLYMFEIRSRLKFLQHTPRSTPATSSNQQTSTPSSSNNTELPASEAALQYPWLNYSATPVLLPPNPMVLLHCFMLLLGVAVWNLLHLGSGWIVWAGDSMAPAVWMGQFVGRHGAGECIQVHRGGQ